MKNKLTIAIPVIGFAKAGGYRVLAKLANEWEKVGHKVIFLNMRESQPYFPIVSDIVDVTGGQIA